MVTPEREERRKILHERYGDGFSMAYIYPAVARSVQSAGRVIRTPTDRGIIVLMDPRFLDTAYSQGLPTDWMPDGDQEQIIVSKAILNDIRAFWDNTPSS